MKPLFGGFRLWWPTAVGAIRWMADDVDAQYDGWRTMWMRNTMGDGGRWGEATAEGRLIIVAPGWLVYLGLVVERKK